MKRLSCEVEAPRLQFEVFLEANKTFLENNRPKLRLYVLKYLIQK